MNSLIVTFFLSVTGTIVSILGFSSCVLLKIFFLLILGIITLVVIFTKRKYLNLYDTLRLLSENNKLHAIREVVVVASNEINKSRNALKIEQAKFIYAISKCKEDKNTFKVSYGLGINFKPCLYPIIKKRVRVISFYAICESISRKMKEQFIDSMQCLLTCDSYSVEIKPLVREVTTDGESQDRSKRFAGLYKISIAIPPSVNLRKNFELRISYDLFDDVFFKERQYDFFIYPSNYSRKIDYLDVMVEVKDINLSQIALYEIEHKNGVSVVGSFTQDPRHVGRYYIKDRIKSPKMNAAYFVQMDYRLDQKN